ncbi:MAG: glycosyltransferase family 39 protein [Patescibacteria group bacterium]
MQWLKKNKIKVILGTFCVVFFVIYSYLPLSQIIQSDISMDEIGMRFNTPDEVMNFHFTNIFVDENKMYYIEPYNLVANGVVFPRWAKPLDDKVTLGTFQGIILIYGSIAKVFSKFVIPFLTPIFAIIGVLFFYGIVRMIFDKKIALISAILMFIFPGFIYYASRTMFHNVLFLSLLLGGIYFLLKLFYAEKNKPSKATPRGKYIYSVLTGLFFGLSLITRTSEIVWVLLIVLIILGFNFKKIKWKYLLISLIIFILCFVPVLANNKAMYGSYLATGYSRVVSENLEEISHAEQIGLFEAMLLPFGFHPRVIVAHSIYKYFIHLFYFHILLFILGLVWFFKSEKTKKQKMYFWFFLMSSIFILTYYGSWFFQDSLDPKLVSVGSSYVRYFLPIYIFALPFVGFLFVKLWELKKKIWNRALVVVLMLSILCISLNMIYSKKPESLVQIKNNLLQYRIQAKDILSKTHPDDIILTDVSNDKVVFPERKHLIIPQNGDELKSVKVLIEFTDVWFFYRSKDINVEYFNENKFNPYGLQIVDSQEINAGGILFKVISDTEYFAKNI